MANTGIRQKTKYAQTLMGDLKRVIGGRDMLMWKEGALWSELHNNKLFRFVFGDDGQNTWASFVASVGVPLSTVEYKRTMYNKWIKELGYHPRDLEGIHTRKLHRAIKFAIDKETADELLLQAKHLSLGGFLEYLKELEGKGRIEKIENNGTQKESET